MAFIEWISHKFQKLSYFTHVYNRVTGLIINSSEVLFLLILP